jgi:hypothetical protein
MLSFLKKGKKEGSPMPTWVLLCVAAVAVGLIVLGNAQTKSESPATQESGILDSDLVKYQEYLENRVRSLCESAIGAPVTAVVTLESGFEQIYATEWQDGKEEYVILGSGSNASALALSQNAPAIMGIGILVHGSLSDAACNEMLGLISASFHTPTNRIFISLAK